MKTKSVVLSVLILLLAIVSVTAAYFLFSKRSELSSGWNKMAAAINRSSAELDRNSGSKYAEKLTVSELSPYKFSSLDKSLAKYQEQIRSVSANRGRLAAILADTALKSDLTGISEDDLRKIDVAESNSAKVVKAFNAALDLRDRNFKRIAASIKSNLGAEITEEGLISGQDGVFLPADKAIAVINDRNHFYEGKLKEISLMVEAPTSFGSRYQEGARNVSDAVERLRDNDVKVLKQLSQMRQDNEDMRQTIARNATAIVNMDRSIAEKKEAVKRLKSRLGLAPDADPIPWANGSKEARAALVGRIVKVNADYGYVAINLGTDTLVHQPIGNGFVSVNPKITKDTNVLIYRGNGKKSRMIARLVLNEVGANVSTANITSETPELEVGDQVRCEAIN